MEKFNLAVTHGAGSINADFESVRAQVRDIKNTYAVVQYSDDVETQMQQMKADRTALNKFAAELDDIRKSVKKSYLVPLEAFEDEIKALIAEIKEPCMIIDTKIKELEEEGRERKRQAIREYYDSISAEVEDDFREELYKRLYDPKWENVSATQKAYKDGLKKGVDEYVFGMKCLKMSNHEFLEDGIREFKLTLDANAALKVMDDKKAQKEELLRREQERMEREKAEAIARAAAEAEAAARAAVEAELAKERARIQAEERAKAEAEAKARFEEEKRAMEEAEKAKAEEVKVTPNTPVSQTVVVPRTVERTVSPVQAQTVSPVVTDANKVTVKFEPTDWESIKKYADRIGIKYTVC